MLTIKTLVLVAHVLIAALIIILVLFQRGKGAEAGAAFGAGASGTVFGARGSANFLSRSTAVLATLFFASSLGLAYLGGQDAPVESILDLDPTSVEIEAAPAETDTRDDELPSLPSATEEDSGEVTEELPPLPEDDQ